MSRVVVGMVTEDERSSMELIMTKLDCANMALKVLPDGSDEERKLYVQATIDAKGNYMWLEKDWWKSIIEKHNLPRELETYLDFNTGEQIGRAHV